MKCKTYHICSRNCLRDFYVQGGHAHLHDGRISGDEIWLKLGGDKGGGYFKIISTDCQHPSTEFCPQYMCFLLL